MRGKKRLWPCEIDALTGGVPVEQRPLSAKTISRIAKGMQKFAFGDLILGPKTKNYWIALWIVSPGKRKPKRAYFPAEIQRTITSLRKKSIPEIQTFIMKNAPRKAHAFMKTVMSLSDTEQG